MSKFNCNVCSFREFMKRTFNENYNKDNCPIKCFEEVDNNANNGRIDETGEQRRKE